MKPNEFMQNSNYGTLKNDTQSNTISVSLSAGATFNPSSNNVLGTATRTVGTRNAGIRARGNSSKSSQWYVGTTVYASLAVSIPSMPEVGVVSTSLYCILQRISPEVVRLTVAVEGTDGSPTFRIEENQTINFVFSTFLSPFN